ncbi:MAG: histidine kinase [Bacteroidales bacterium]|nr:histidine kinase [Bacteroidales bacterium]
MGTNTVYQIFLFFTCFLQVFAAVIAVRLTRITKSNLSWILICAGLVTWSVRSVIDIVRIFVPQFGFESNEPYSWGGIFISFCFAIGVYLIKNIFVYNREAEEKQRAYEKRLLNSVIEAEEKERKRFSTELHDGLGPILSSIKMGFSAVSNEVSDPEVRTNLNQAIAEAITTVREVSNNLSPHVLNNFGIEKAISNFIGKLNVPQGLNIKYDISFGSTRYQPTIEIVVYRVICELINNTIRHARATLINIYIQEQKGKLLLEYADNGIGFTPSVDPEGNVTETTGSGMGYYNIVSRVSSLKGTVSYGTYNQLSTSRPGVLVKIEIPLKGVE